MKKKECVIAIIRTLARKPARFYLQFIQSDITKHFKVCIVASGWKEFKLDPEEKAAVKVFKANGGSFIEGSPTTTIVGKSMKNAYRLIGERYDFSFYSHMGDDSFVKSEDALWVLKKMKKTKHVGYSAALHYFERLKTERLRGNPWAEMFMDEFVWGSLHGFHIWSAECLKAVGKPWSSKSFLAEDRVLLRRVFKAKFRVFGHGIAVKSETNFLKTRLNRTAKEKAKLIDRSEKYAVRCHPELKERITKWFKRVRDKSNYAKSDDKME